MSTSLSIVEEAYQAAFAEYLARGAEESLRAAYELGREAIRERMSVLELGGVHHRALASALSRRPPTSSDEVTRAAAEFWREAASAFEMVQRGFQEVTEMARLEREHAARLRALADASLAINSTLSANGILQVLADRSRGLVGAHLSVARVMNDPRRGLGGEAVSFALGDSWRGVIDQLADIPREWLGSPPKRLVSVTREELEEWSEWRALARRLPRPVSGVISALLSEREGMPIGLVELVGSVDGDFDETDESMLAQLANIASVAIENAHLYERERLVAETLQHRLLPDRLPDVPGVTVAARYLPGGVGVHVGGDWYDLVQVGEGRVGIAVGDVVGRGAGAAALMGQVRTAFRACAFGEDRPEAVVARLDELLQAIDQGHFSTMVYLILDPVTGRMRLVRAGHPAPLLLAPDGATRFLDAGHGMPLGAFPDASREASTIILERGSLLILYTDGLVESRLGIGEGSERLARSVRDIAETTPGLDAMCDRILAEMIGAEPQDDVALLMVRRD